jgi:hypothetical protein
MLQQPARPSGNVQLPYTTADMAERLAKRKAAKDRQDILDSLSGGLSYGQGGVDITPQLSQVGGMVKGLIQMPAATVMDIVSGIVRPLEKYVGGVKDPVDQFRPEDYGTSNFISGTAQGLEQATRRAVGDITAIPRVGKPSASPTATDIRRFGVIEGLSKAGIDYGNLALTATPFVKPSAFGISNAYKDMLEARLARQNRSPFPAVKTPGAFIDVDALQGSRLPARIVDTPATPATRLAEAQTQRGLTPTAIDQPMTLSSKNITTIEKSASGGGQQKLVLTNSDGRRLATVTYDLRNDPMTAMPSRIEVDYLKSNFEGQGHGQELMQNLYDRYPNSFIDWGETINPTSTHMAEKFADRYYDRTAYEPDIDQGVVGTEGMYSGEPDVFDTPATPATRLAEAQAARELPEELLIENYLNARQTGVIPTEIPPSLQEALSAWLERQGISNVTPDMLAQGFKNKQGILSMPANPNAPLPSISLKSGALADVLDSGGYGSMFDGGVSTRTENYDLWRQGNEAMLYGLTEGDPRPIYGFLRSPGDPYTAAGYGKTVQSVGLEGVTADDNFIINIKPNAPMTSAPADSFRVNDPSDVMPLTSKDKPATTGYREVQIWADKIPTSDIQSAELVFAEPRALFRTILRDSDTPISDTLNAYIGKIDALLGTKIPDLYGKTETSVLDKLNQKNIPTTITVRRDFGLTPRVTNEQQVRMTLMALRREAATYLQRIATEGEIAVKQQINNEIATLFADPQQNYMAELIRRGEQERAGQIWSQMSLKGNANPFYPGDNVYNKIEAASKAFKSPKDIEQFIAGSNVSSILETPKIAEIIFAIHENKLDQAAKLIADNYTNTELFNKFTERYDGDFNLIYFEELNNSESFTTFDNKTKNKIVQKLFDSLSTDQRILLDKKYSEYESNV